EGVFTKERNLRSSTSQLGSRVTEAETTIYDLEDASNSRGTSIDSAISNLKKFQDKVRYLDAGSDFVLNILVEKLGLDVEAGCELERTHRIGPKLDDGRSRHILAHFLRFNAREAIVRAARKKRRVEWQGIRISFFQDLFRDVLQQRRKFDTVKKQFQKRGMSYSIKTLHALTQSRPLLPKLVMSSLIIIQYSLSHRRHGEPHIRPWA
uniref:L1 transposable element RRM domain-containing protein n=1 Tax=Mola mola TaxID=94237 RepID=A0A3Q4AZF9_MOLML